MSKYTTKLALEDLRQQIRDEGIYATISNNYFNKRQLVERGWTKGMINKIIPYYDDEYTYPRHLNSAKLYKKSRIYAFERGKRWKALHEKSLRNIERGKKSWATFMSR